MSTIFDSKALDRKHRRLTIIKFVVIGLVLVGFTTGAVTLAKNLTLTHSHAAAITGFPTNNTSTSFDNSPSANTPTYTPSTSNTHTSVPTLTRPSPTPTTYTNSVGNQIESPDYNSTGATAMCKDGTFSHSQSAQGTCSDHGGVDHWLNQSSPTTSSTPTSTTCSDKKANYQTAVDQENNRHTNAIAQIQLQYSQQLDGMSSGLEQNAIDQENQTHQQNLTNLQNQYNTAIAGLNC